MHCAHPDGLGCPILGDELYGRPADRLYLHAELLELTHPVTAQRMRFEQPAPFLDNPASA
jgi:tRNA pseudouridine32 synthase/23S rRNA pseudouridine746 synthase